MRGKVLKNQHVFHGTLEVALAWQSGDKVQELPWHGYGHATDWGNMPWHGDRHATDWGNMPWHGNRHATDWGNMPWHGDVAYHRLREHALAWWCGMPQIEGTCPGMVMWHATDWGNMPWNGDGHATDLGNTPWQCHGASNDSENLQSYSIQF